MNDEDYVHTPFGMIKKPEVEKRPSIDSTPQYCQNYTKEHGWFDHLFDENGNVK